MGETNNRNGPGRIKRWWRKLATTTIAVIATLSMGVGVAFADMQGIDVSGWQPSDITSRVTADFAIVKTTQGTGYVNPNANAQIANAQATGKEIGIYHYAGGGDCNAEADYFLKHSAGYVRKAVLILDWESDQNAQWGNSAWPTCWVNRVKQQTAGVIPMVYVSASALGQVAGARAAGSGLWVAQYANTLPTGYQSHPWKLGAYGEAMRQYTSTGVLPGYSGYLDLNVFRGDKTAWRKYANPSGTGSSSSSMNTTTPAPTPSPSNIDWDALATAVIRGEYGNLPQRRTNLDTAYGSGTYDRVQAIVNQRFGGTSSTQQSSGSGGTAVTVRAGDTISAIATRTGLYPLTAWSVPSGNINRIWPGQVVRYNGGGSVSTASNAPPSRTVTVRSGDTLSAIASQLGVQWTQLHGYRSGNPNLIYPGEVLTY